MSIDPDEQAAFAEPWQARALAVARQLVEHSGREWDDFRTHLVTAIDQDADRPYYESFVVALERFAIATGDVDAAALARARNGVSSYRYHEEGLGDVEAFPFRPDHVIRHADLYRTWADGAPAAHGLRLFDDDGAAIIDAPLPAERWEQLRRRLLGLRSDGGAQP